MSENRLNPEKPNGFADHYPYEKWLFHWEYTQHFQTNPHGELVVTLFPGRWKLFVTLVTGPSRPSARHGGCSGVPTVVVVHNPFFTTYCLVITLCITLQIGVNIQIRGSQIIQYPPVPSSHMAVKIPRFKRRLSPVNHPITSHQNRIKSI